MAVDLLDWARLLAPGGLVEEAALRREIALLAEAKDMSRLAVLTRQYVTRFGASLYAADFLRDLASAVARLGLADDPANYKLISGALASLPPDGRRDFLLNLAKSGVVSGRFVAAASAATRGPRKLEGRQPGGDARAPLSGGQSTVLGRVRCGAGGSAGSFDGKTRTGLTPACWPRLEGWRRSSGVVPDQSVFNTQNAAALPDADKSKPSGPELTIAKAQEALQRTSNLAPPTRT